MLRRAPFGNSKPVNPRFSDMAPGELMRIRHIWWRWSRFSQVPESSGLSHVLSPMAKRGGKSLRSRMESSANAAATSTGTVATALSCSAASTEYSRATGPSIAIGLMGVSEAPSASGAARAKLVSTRTRASSMTKTDRYCDLWDLNNMISPTKFSVAPGVRGSLRIDDGLGVLIPYTKTF